MEKTIWPNFFIIGARRAGTTTIYESLRSIPDICLSSIKEPDYFSTYPYRPYKDANSYLKLFKNVKSARIICEASTVYLADPMSPILIHNTIPHAKLIAILRNPIERAFSNYLHDRKLKNINVKFEDVVYRELKIIDEPYYIMPNYIRFGFYYDNIKQYKELFGENFKIFIFEEFIRKPQEHINEILKFLGIPYIKNINIPMLNKSTEFNTSLLNIIIRNINKRKFIRHIYINAPPILQHIAYLSYRKIIDSSLLMSVKNGLSINIKKMLKEIYVTDVNNLKSLLKRDLPWDEFNGD